MRMSSYGKRKGATFETSVMKWLRSKKVFAERLTKAGAKDEGDIVAIVAGLAGLVLVVHVGNVTPFEPSKIIDIMLLL